MLAYACDFAFGKRRAAATPSVRRPERVQAVALVGAASGADLAGHSFPADPAEPSELADLSGASARRAGVLKGGGPTAARGGCGLTDDGAAAADAASGSADHGAAGSAGSQFWPASTALPEPAAAADR